MKKGVILDVDGTLWDAVHVIMDSWNAYRKMAVPEMPGAFCYEEISGILGKTMTEIGDICFAPLDPERRRAVMEEIMEYEVLYLREHPGKVYPGVKETLERLNDLGYSITIVSNCQKGYIEDFLLASETERLIEDHVCFGDTLQKKSFSIRLCAERNHLDQAVYVGDTAGDLISAREAGCGFVYARYGFGSVDPEKEGVPAVDSFTELPEVLECEDLWKVRGTCS